MLLSHIFLSIFCDISIASCLTACVVSLELTQLSGIKPDCVVYVGQQNHFICFVQDHWLKKGKLGPTVRIWQKEDDLPSPLVWINKKIIPKYSSTDTLGVEGSLCLMEVQNILNCKGNILKTENFWGHLSHINLAMPEVKLILSGFLISMCLA